MILVIHKKHLDAAIIHAMDLLLVTIMNLSFVYKNAIRGKYTWISIRTIQDSKKFFYRKVFAAPKLGGPVLSLEIYLFLCSISCTYLLFLPSHTYTHVDFSYFFQLVQFFPLLKLVPIPPASFFVVCFVHVFSSKSGEKEIFSTG